MSFSKEIHNIQRNPSEQDSLFRDASIVGLSNDDDGLNLSQTKYTRSQQDMWNIIGDDLR